LRVAEAEEPMTRDFEIALRQFEASHSHQPRCKTGLPRPVNGERMSAEHELASVPKWVS